MHAGVLSTLNARLYRKRQGKHVKSLAPNQLSATIREVAKKKTSRRTNAKNGFVRVDSCITICFMYCGRIANDDATVWFWKAAITRQPSSQVHVLIPGRVPISSSLDQRKPVMGEPMRLWESECEIPVHSPSSETLNEQLRRAERLPIDTRKYMKDIPSY